MAGSLPSLYLEYWCQKEHETVLALISVQVVRQLGQNKNLKNLPEGLKKRPEAVCKNLGGLNLPGALGSRKGSKFI